jgi:DNA polymerase-3 subunit alpha
MKQYLIYKDRLDHELEIIVKMDYSSYFLIVSDYIKWAKNNDIPVGPGRGSGAGSLVAWCLSITDVDPIKYNLNF